MDLPKPFFVLATQNPIEQEGTYPLPEAQLDRFLFNIYVDYPALEEERAVVRATTIGGTNSINPVLSSQEVLDLQFALRAMPVTDAVVDYAVDLARKTRPGKAGGSDVAANYFAWGAGPRASQNLVLAAKAIALMNGEGTPSTAHVRQIATAVLRHRVVVNYKAKGEGLTVDHLIGQLL